MEMIVVISCLLTTIFTPSPVYSSTLPNDAEQMLNTNVVLAAVTDQSESNQLHITLQTVNHISLYDDVMEVLNKKGIPNHITDDPYFKDYKTYEYRDMSITFNNDLIDSVQLNVDSDSSIYLDERKVPATLDAITELLGSPDYQAEDGIVFERGEALLKLFVDKGSKQINAIAYYHIAST